MSEIKRTVHVYKFDSRRNGKRCAAYFLFDGLGISSHHFVRYIPKRFLPVLEKAKRTKADQYGYRYSLKNDKFIITFKNEKFKEYDNFGRFEFKDVESIVKYRKPRAKKIV